MVQQYQSPVRVYKHPFEMVMAAYEKRFPTCDMIPVFVGCEILSDVENPDKSTHVVERRCKLNIDAPRFLKRMVGFEYIYFVQKNALNRKERSLKISAYNESFSSRVIVNETCQYTVHPDNPNWTCFEQSATMEIKSFFGFESSVEKLAMKQYAANIKKGKEIIEYYLNEIQAEGVTYIPTWAEENPHLVKSPTVGNSSASSNTLQEDLTELNDGSRCSSFSSVCDEPPSDRNKKGTANLEEEYIEHNLGVLQPLEESKLIQLRKWLADTHNGKIPRDEHILRFLRSRDFHFEKSKEILCQSLSWRKQHQVDKILTNWSPPPLFEEYYIGGWHYHAIDSRPIYVLRLGQMDTKGLLKAAGEEQILKHVLYIMEQGLLKCREASIQKNKPMSNGVVDCHISSWTCIVDLEGLNMRHLWRPGVQALLRIIEVIEANYPETMSRLLIVRSPRVFPVLWTLISPFIDEKTSSKFMMYTGTDYMGAGGLVDYIPQEFIPEFLGGPCKCEIPDGGPVPKSLYKTEWEKGDGIALWEDTIYKSANVLKGAPHEVVVEVPERDGVITWDFDSLKGDVIFTLFHSNSQLGPIQEDTVQCTGISNSTSASNPQAPFNTQVIGKHMTLGKDYTLVESGIVCREGESVQGSHIARKAGSYVMQWKFHGNPPQSTSVQDVLYQVTHNPKSKVIYYHELLPSENFRGSMSSLESCQSAFSALSHVTGSSLT
uniref:SEC14-like protein 5 isoform X1 n=1 Tax=Ciona intestinalis TaxID=7719 RepID=UPI0002B8E0A4|nr:SEC14-like protein 5 isoform X1 [Ciona intestinalis]|eukprot:XP_002121052.2 SEC14-like protein 5 isoform X1 [Ciona intestinalis]